MYERGRDIQVLELYCFVARDLQIVRPDTSIEMEVFTTSPLKWVACRSHKVNTTMVRKFTLYACFLMNSLKASNKLHATVKSIGDITTTNFELSFSVENPHSPRYNAPKLIEATANI